MNAMKRRSSRSVVHALSAVVLAGFSLLAPRPAEAQAIAEPSHLYWASTLVAHIAPVNNEYGTGPSYVTWAGVRGATEYRSRSFCTTFVTNVLKQAYGLSTYEISTWFGSTSPNAIVYRDTIVDEIGFAEILDVNDIEAGDIVAIVYPAGSGATGHVAIAAGAPAPRVSTWPVIAGTTQYELAVLDASSTGHGFSDTRLNADGTWHSGVGKGIMRLYAGSNGSIAGYAWSAQAGSTFYAKSSRDIVVGRVTEPYIALPLPE